MPEISVIVPVYNRESYLDKCLQSVLSQEGVNVEIIIIESSSTDNSPAICDRYASEHSCIKVFHTENLGISAARNRGLSEVTGDYIVFLDSDDYISEGSLKFLLDTLKTSGADYVIGNAVREREDGTVANDKLIPQKYFNTLVDARTVLDLTCDASYHFLFVVLWAKLYKKEMFDGIHFPSVIFGEDECVLPYLLKDGVKAYITDFVVYHQTLSNSSLIRVASFDSSRFYAPLTKLMSGTALADRGVYDIAVKKLTIAAGEILQLTKRVKSRSEMPVSKNTYREAVTLGKKLFKYMHGKKKIKYSVFRVAYPLFYSFLYLTKPKQAGNNK